MTLLTNRGMIQWMVAGLLMGLIAFEPCFAQDPTGRPPTRPPRDRRATPTPAPPPQPVTVTLTILTDPPESTVLIDGEVRGVTDGEGRARFDRLALGTYVIEVRKDGFISASRAFQAGPETPTLSFRLEADLQDEVRQFDTLIAEGRLSGPDSPNALELTNSLSNRFPERPEVIRMRGVLAGRLLEPVGPVIERTTGEWKRVGKEELLEALNAVMNSLALKDDVRATSQGAYLEGVIALRDWQTSRHPDNELLANARSGLERAITVDEIWGAPHYKLGLVLQHLGDHRGAEVVFQRATQLDPRSPHVHAALGFTLYSLNKHREAVLAFTRSTDLDSSFVGGVAGLGLARMASGDNRQGQRDIDRARQLDPSSGLPHLYTGLIQAQSRRRRDQDRAIQELTTAIQKNSDGLEFNNRLAEEVLASLQTGRRR